MPYVSLSRTTEKQTQAEGPGLTLRVMEVLEWNNKHDLLNQIYYLEDSSVHDIYLTGCINIGSQLMVTLNISEAMISNVDDVWTRKRKRD